MSDDQSTRIAQLEAEIRQLETAVAGLQGLPDAQASLQSQLATKQAELAGLRPTQTPLRVDAAGAERDVNIAGRDQTIYNFFGGKPPENGAELVSDYLTALHDQLAPLRLARISTARKSGRGDSLLPPLQLADVFTNLTTNGAEVVLHDEIVTAAKAEARLEQADFAEHAADEAPPEDVRSRQIVFRDPPDEAFFARIGKRKNLAISDLPGETPLHLRLVRPPLALETLARHPRLVLLGAPGSGKSTVLTYLVLQLAAVPPIAPTGWATTPVPVLCPLGKVAAAISRKRPEQSDAGVLWQVLERLLDGEGDVRKGLGRHLRPALRRGGALLLFDGLDEIAATPGADGLSLRTRVSRAVQSLARELPRATPIALTCRVLPYEQPAASPADDWKLPADDGWTVERIEPLAFGQVRQFVGNWYAAACQSSDALYRAEEGERRAASLLDQLAGNERLRKLIESPLLLTMLALLHYNKETGELPRDRARLYDECVELLLDRWEPVRQPGVSIPGLLERLGIEKLAGSADLRAVMHRVALHAHDRPPDPGDGRGRLRGSEIEGELSRFLRKLRCEQIEDKLAAFEQALRDETGLLHELGDDVFAFPHLTFQEYLAACALAEERDLAERAYGFWRSAEGDRWREVLLLMVGRLRQQGAVDRQGMDWLRALLHPQAPDNTPKPVAQRGRDALLAADSYREWEGRAALRSYDAEEIDQVEGRIARALLSALAPQTSLALPERLRAATQLGAFGDPRFPVHAEQWRSEVQRRNEHFGDAAEWDCSQPRPYFCYVRPDAYRIGGWNKKEKSAEITLPGFWIARFPITVAQFTPFVAAGYAPQAEQWWTPADWRWKQESRRSQPLGWNESGYNGPNQPVTGVTWYEARAYCAWLTARLAGVLPPDLVLRLPTEAEWEAAAAYDADGQRRPFPWGAASPTVDRAVYQASGLNRPAPVGCCPTGAAAGGALDMAGNVWEVTTSRYNAYPAQSAQGKERFTTHERDVPWRGGNFTSESTNVRCGARVREDPGIFRYDYVGGLRVVLAPRLAHMS